VINKISIVVVAFVYERSSKEEYYKVIFSIAI
jgi:hypothetical protein